MSAEAPRFVLLWRNRHLTASAESLADMAEAVTAAARELTAMLATRRVWLVEGGAPVDRACLATDDEAVAGRFGFQEAAEFGEDFPDDDPDDADGD